MARGASKTKKSARRKALARRLPKRSAVIEVSALGVLPEYMLTGADSKADVDLAPAYFSIALPPPPDLPAEPTIFQRPLVATRTAFWLGVGFGMLVVGTLGALTWQFIKVEVVEAVMLGLGR